MIRPAERHAKVLDHGFVTLEDFMGNDKSITDAARVSTGTNAITKSDADDERLIRYLMRHRHTTPFEMCEAKFLVRCPIFVARQWLRHRTANVNEMSARYRVMPDLHYIPDMDRLTKQSKQNKQGSSEEPVPFPALNHGSIEQSQKAAFATYLDLLNDGLNRETARNVLPVSTYTDFYWKIDLHNLFHFLSLRMDEHAQWEIRQYANAMSDMVKAWVPVAWQAWHDYEFAGVRLSDAQVLTLRLITLGSVDRLEDIYDGSIAMSWDERHSLWGTFFE